MLTVLPTVQQVKIIFTPQFEIGIAIFKPDNDIKDKTGNKRSREKKVK